MKAETLQDLVVSSYPEGWRRRYAMAVFEDLGIPHDVTVYRECPECGGLEQIDSGEVDGHVSLRVSLPCPACADQPVAIVSAALREKACAALLGLTREELADEVVIEGEDGAPHVYLGQKEADDTFDALGEQADAVLSTVLGQVRYAKEIHAGYLGEKDGLVFMTDGQQTIGTLGLLSGPTMTIAILEDVDSTDTSAAHVESAGGNRQEAGKEE